MMDGFCLMVFDDTLGVVELREGLTWQEANEELTTCFELMATLRVGDHFIEGHVYENVGATQFFRRCAVFGRVRPSGVR